MAPEDDEDAKFGSVMRCPSFEGGVQFKRADGTILLAEEAEEYRGYLARKRRKGGASSTSSRAPPPPPKCRSGAAGRSSPAAPREPPSVTTTTTTKSAAVVVAKGGGNPRNPGAGSVVSSSSAQRDVNSSGCMRVQRKPLSTLIRLCGGCGVTLLVGHTGTGKSWICRTVARILGRKLIVVAPEQGAAAVASVLRETATAKTLLGPPLVVIDNLEGFTAPTQGPSAAAALQQYAQTNRSLATAVIATVTERRSTPEVRSLHDHCNCAEVRMWPPRSDEVLEVVRRVLRARGETPRRAEQIAARAPASTGDLRAALMACELIVLDGGGKAGAAKEEGEETKKKKAPPRRAVAAVDLGARPFADVEALLYGGGEARARWMAVRRMARIDDELHSHLAWENALDATSDIGYAWAVADGAASADVIRGAAGNLGERVACCDYAAHVAMGSAMSVAHRGGIAPMCGRPTMRFPKSLRTQGGRGVERVDLDDASHFASLKGARDRDRPESQSRKKRDAPHRKHPHKHHNSQNTQQRSKQKRPRMC